MHKDLGAAVAVACVQAAVAEAQRLLGAVDLRADRHAAEPVPPTTSNDLETAWAWLRRQAKSWPTC
jgi:hypothetical protein